MLNADRERRVNAAVVRHHANAMAVYGGGESFAVVFVQAPAVFEGMAEAVAPTVAFDIAHAPDIAMDAPILINDEEWTVAGGLTPDAAGWVTVRLSKGI